MPPTTNRKLLAWVDEVAALTTPDRVEWCDGSAEEYDRLCQLLVDKGTFTRLSEAKRPNSYWAHSDPGDVARVEDRTFICSKTEADAGPTNNWRDPDEMRATLDESLRRVHAGPDDVRRPLLDGPARLAHRPHRRRDHRLALRGRVDADHDPHGRGRPSRSWATTASSSPASTRWAPRSSPGQADVPWPCDAENKYIVHFPETREIWSYGSGYGGNALLGKKCFALRIASVMARDDGWLAEHMLILKLTSPDGEIRYVTGAFPSACGKTNLAMLIPTLPGLEGRDHRRRHLLDEVRRRRPALRAINPEAGFFGVAPGTNTKTNPNAMLTLGRRTHLHQHRPHRRRRRLVGGDDRRAAGAPDRLAGRGLDPGARAPRPPTPTPASPSRRPRTRPSPRSGRTRRACRSRPSSSAAGGPRWCRWSSSPSTGSTACSSARSWPRRPPPRRPAPSATSAATPSPCSRSAATTWPTTSATGSTIGARRPTRASCPRSSTSTGSARTPTAGSCGPATARTPGCSSGSSSGSAGRARPSRRRSATCPAPGPSTPTGLDVSKEDMDELLRVDADEWRAEVPLIREHYASSATGFPRRHRRREAVDELERRLG